MAFFLPWLAVGVGGSLFGWGLHQLITKNDSADEVLSKVIAVLPEKLAEYVESVEELPDGTRRIVFRKDTPEEVQKEIEDNLSFEEGQSE